MRRKPGEDRACSSGDMLTVADRHTKKQTYTLHCVPIKTPTFYFMNNSVKYQVIRIIFGTQNAEEIQHK